MSEFNLKELQAEFLGEAHNLIIPENYKNKERDQRQKSVRKIVDMYTNSRKGEFKIKSTYQDLKDNNKWTRLAAVDLICQYGNQKSMEHLFKALEDEENRKIKQKIAKSIDKLEIRLNNLEITDSVSLMDTVRILSYEQ